MPKCHSRSCPLLGPTGTDSPLSCTWPRFRSHCGRIFRKHCCQLTGTGGPANTTILDSELWCFFRYGLPHNVCLGNSEKSCRLTNADSARLEDFRCTDYAIDHYSEKKRDSDHVIYHCEQDPYKIYHGAASYQPFSKQDRPFLSRQREQSGDFTQKQTFCGGQWQLPKFPEIDHEPKKKNQSYIEQLIADFFNHRSSSVD